MAQTHSTETAMFEDLLKNTAVSLFTDDQIAEIRKVFMIFDQQVTLTIPIDCVPLALRALGRLPTEAQTQKILDEFGDTALVDFAQFCALIYRDRWGMLGSEEELRSSIVNGFDPRHTGRLNKKWFIYKMTTIGDKLTQQEINEMLFHFDIDGEGEIEYEDMIQQLLE